jgi:hypothetical protein
MVSLREKRSFSASAFKSGCDKSSSAKVLVVTVNLGREASVRFRVAVS